MVDIFKKPPHYYCAFRPEILNAIPVSAGRVLDIGCGTGTLGRAIKKRQDCKVDGLEKHKPAWDEAFRFYDTAYLGDVEKFDFPRFEGNYDVIVLGDVLEHLVDPWGALRRVSSLLAENGLIVASFPNVSHPAIGRELSRGLFRYAAAGTLDVTHLRFFTATTACQLFVKNNFKVISITSFPSQKDPQQFIVRARKIQPCLDSYGTTIIMPVFNGLEYTKEAVGSIRANTECPYKIIVVDNGSTDGTAEWVGSCPDVLYIRRGENLGFPTAVNLGMECVDTPFFCIVNNDIVVTPGWLCDMAKVAAGDSKIGIVGPMTNEISGPQKDSAARYGSPGELLSYVENRRAAIKPRIHEFPRIVFFCTLIKSELLEKVGLLDEVFGLGTYEDDDYCLRSLKAGYKNVIDRHVFIHHYCSSTLKKMGDDYRKLMERNALIFRRKWEGNLSSGPEVPDL